MTLLGALVAALLTTAPMIQATTATAAPRARPAPTLLVLGDSISFGFQAAKVGASPDPAAFSTGYADVLAARDPRLSVVNLSCPGETTTSMISGGCPWTAAGFALHDDYFGSQLNAAVGYLRSHRPLPVTVTLAIWGNDIAALSQACGGDVTCVGQRAPDEIAAFAGRLGTILRALRRAGPSARIVVVAAFHTFPPPSPEIDALYAALNEAIAGSATTSRALVADVVPLFDPADPAARRTATCTMTLTCSSGDPHPSDVGYIAIADTISALLRRPCP